MAAASGSLACFGGEGGEEEDGPKPLRELTHIGRRQHLYQGGGRGAGERGRLLPVGQGGRGMPWGCPRPWPHRPLPGPHLQRETRTFSCPSRAVSSAPGACSFFPCRGATASGDGSCALPLPSRGGAGAVVPFPLVAARGGSTLRLQVAVAGPPDGLPRSAAKPGPEQPLPAGACGPACAAGHRTASPGSWVPAVREWPAGPAQRVKPCIPFPFFSNPALQPAKVLSVRSR